MSNVSRRHLLAVIGALGVGALIPTTEAAQDVAQRAQLPIPPDQAGEFHRRMLADFSERLGKSSLVSVDGLSALVDRLVQLKLITQEDGERLKELIHAIFSKDPMAAIRDRIETIYKQLRQKGSDVSIAIASIARDSLRFVIENKRAMIVVAQDVTGAITGAATGAALGGPVAAFLCAAAGAVSSSAIAGLGEK